MQREIILRRLAVEAAEDFGDEAMSLFRANVWSVVDIGLLKWCCVLIGMIVGAHLADFTKQNVWFIALGALLLGIKPAVSYFRGGRE